MLTSITTILLAASVAAPQPTQTLVNPQTGAPTMEVGLLSAPLPGELSVAVRTWALSQRERYGLPIGATLRFTDAFGTRFGASFHLQQQVKELDVYQAKLVVTLDPQRRVDQVASSLVSFTRVLDGDALTFDQAMTRAARELPLVALRPDGVPYGGARAFYFPVGGELHRGWVANVQSLDLSKNWYVGIDAVTGERLFVQNRVHHAQLDAQVYPVSPGGLDAGVGATPTVLRELRHTDGGSMIGDTCVFPQLDGGFPEGANDGGHLCGTQLMMYNCCPSAGCAPDAGPKRQQGVANYMGAMIAYDVAVCDRLRRASNQTSDGGDYVYAPVDPPSNRAAVVASDLANSDEFAEVHSFYHVNTVYDWMRKLSTTAAPIFAGQQTIQPFKMRDERRPQPVKPAVWTNVMFPNFQEIFAALPGCFLAPPCRANTLIRLDNAAFFPRENFAQIPLAGFDTGADTLMIFQGNAADAAYDATVIQHEFGHGAVYATANLGFEEIALDARSANNEGGALHEGFADYIAAAFNNLAEVGPYFGPRAAAGQPMQPGVRTDAYLRSMDNTLNCPEVLWGEVHQDSMHVAGALWTGRKTVFAGTDNGETFDAAFYAMLVSLAPNADFAAVAAAMSQRVATAFPGVAMASQQMTQIFMSRGVIGCSKVLNADSNNLPRPYFGIVATQALGQSIVPGPVQLKVAATAGALRIRVTGSAQAGGFIPGGAAPSIRVMTRNGSPVTFTRAGNVLSNDAEKNVTATNNNGNFTGTVELNAPCNTDIYVAVGTPGGGATVQNLNVAVDPLVNCMIPMDAGTGGGAGGDGGATGGGGGNTMTTTIPGVGPGSVTEQPVVKTGCGCSSPADVAAPLMALLALAGLRRRRK